MPWTQPVPGPHVRPHIPQFAPSALVSVHEFEHGVCPGKHVLAHTPAEHASVPVHVTPQPPQFPGSTLVGIHWPLQNDVYGGQVHVWLVLQI